MISKYRIDTLTDASGRIITQDTFRVYKSTKVKRGWNRVYKEQYDNAIKTLSSKLDIDIFFHIRDNTATNLQVMINQTALAKKMKTSRQKVSLVIRRLIEIDYLRKIDGVYHSTPFGWIPYNMPNEAIEEAQTKWLENNKSKENNNGRSI